MDYFIPADIPANQHKNFIRNYQTITHQTNNLFLFAADQKIEHLNQDFFGHEIAPAAHNPHHIFDIANTTPIGALALHLGLLARYAKKYPNINYVVKLNGKTNLVPTEQADPLSEQLWSIDDVLNLQKSAPCTICGVGYTIYLGSIYESIMLKQAAHIVLQAHQNGLVAILWIYPRGKAVTHYSPELFSGAAGVAHSLGADFVKLSVPLVETYHVLAPAIQAAGNTKIICSGGKFKDIEQLLHDIDQQQKAGFSGVAIGRNLFQRSFTEAQKLAQSIASIVYK